jgi:diguanylate cyclase (GGDEF)-like protein
MQQLLFRFAPVILFITGLVYFLIANAAADIRRGRISLSFLLFILIQMPINLICGIIIRKLYHYSYKDALTGLFNRRYFYTKINKIKIKELPMSLIMIDIDNFKKINDTYGHLAGDYVLKNLSKILQSNVRKGDIVFRWGGEEFAVLLKGTTDEKSFTIADRLRKSVELFDFSDSKWNIEQSITISVGVVSTSKKINHNLMVDLADNALYRAKQTKNLVVCMDDVCRLVS